MKKFTKIQNLRSVVKNIVSHYRNMNMDHKIPKLTFIGTVKLHGSNVGISRDNNTKQIKIQSRNNSLTVENDNYGFAKFISEIPSESINTLFDMISTEEDDTITIFGEWVGKGIQNIVAVSELEKHWVIFGAWSEKNQKYLSNFKELQLHEHQIYNILEIEPFNIKIDFKNPQASIEALEKRTDAVETECPWAKKFGISGIGEGIVWVCLDHPSNSDLWFKTKGKKHVKEAHEKTNINVEIPNINTVCEKS